MFKKSLFSLILLFSSTSFYAYAVISPTENIDQNPAFVKTSELLSLAQKNSAALDLFLENMPKGADLHVHTDGAAYAEDLVHYGLKDSWCVDPTSYNVSLNGKCQPNNRLSAIVLDQARYDALIDAWSLRNFPFNSESGEQHFFSTFMKYIPLVFYYPAQTIADIVNRAALQHEEYIELMLDSTELNVKAPSGETESDIGQRLGFQNNFAQMRTRFLNDPNLKAIINEIPTRLDQIKTSVNQHLQCQTKTAQPGCQMQVRYLYLGFRNLDAAPLFAQLLTAFEVAQKDSDIVGVNLVMPENGYVSLRDYTLQMQMIGYLHQTYPKVKISLHAGELVEGQVKPKDLSFHIRQAVEIAKASRIGHGVDVAYETHAGELLHEMANQHILVEINQTSNADILGLKASEHPFLLYFNNHVPTALSTDDEAVLRTNLTHEFADAIENYHLSYSDVKRLARNSITYSFMPGQSLWQSEYPFVAVSACQADLAHPTQSLGAACSQFLKQSPKAHLQWQLEKDFQMFEQANLTTKTQ